ncbi:DASH complex subunit Ask1-domain-containing protein [Xylogone sp. PMI_703]|nr:DASH complex subunit Ask1-domain-containing protein [Xylogone sp. PMI_703]
MSRASTSSRNLSLTEELEKLEQSITLTLQEIDHNFSRAHRIVTTSILPIVEQYAEHSNSVWEGSKFWKQFFEASANVSLSGVEEREEEEDISYSQDATSNYENSISQQGDDTLQTSDREHYAPADESLLDSADISGSTPRAPRARSNSRERYEFADYGSPYEDLKEEVQGGSKTKNNDDVTQLRRTPGLTRRIPDMSMNPSSSPFEPTSRLPSTAQRRPGGEPVLHKVLDKTYLVQATPHTARKQNKTPIAKPSWRDSTSPMSSPPEAAPQLRADIFSSPIRQQFNHPPAPRTPGISVQTPAKSQRKGDVTQKLPMRDEITWESDSDEDPDEVYKELGMSPPKTIQFVFPQSRLLQTPAREASKRIVEDLLATAGAGFNDTDGIEDSPSMVAVKDDLDDSF